MEWLTHTTTLFVGFVLGILFSRQKQKKVVESLKEGYKINFEEYKKRRG